MAIKQKKEE